MSSLAIKPLTTADIPKVRALHSALLPVSYPTSFFIQLTLLSGRVCLVAYHPENPTEPVAFVSASLQENPRVNTLTNSLILDGKISPDTKVPHDTPHIEILTIGVLPAYQQQGIARLLVQQVYDYFREHSTPSRQLSDNSLIHTNVATSNVPALTFYERIGLKVASGVIRNLYRACPHGSKDGYLLVDVYYKYFVSPSGATHGFSQSNSASAFSSVSPILRLLPSEVNFFSKSNIYRKHSKPSPAHKHNGELQKGAWKTRVGRPWIMEMIVHGFPSRLAALQFEWAWQHPHQSRHLRDSDGVQLFGFRRSKQIKANVHTWPLHVKLFSDQAVAAWTAASRHSAPMPPGFTCTIELEGVNGKSGKVGSGRSEPINVKDEKFTFSYLAKNTALLASNNQLHCSVCQTEILNYTTDPLSTALCPNSSCKAVSHITCLAKKFLTSDPSSMSLIPRGGTCISCNTYTLWGDIIRGSYRRKTGGETVEIEEDEENMPYLSEDEPYASDSDSHSENLPPNTSTSKRKTKTKAFKTRKPRQGTKKLTSSSEGEFFEFDGVSSTDETPRKRGRPRKVVSSTISIPSGQQTAVVSSSRQADGSQYHASRPIDVSSEGELFDSDRVTFHGTSATPPVVQVDHVAVLPRKRGRPRKATLIPSGQQTAVVSASRQADGSQYHASRSIDVSSEGELFDSDRVTFHGTSATPPVVQVDHVAVLPRKRGRPRKVPPNASLVPASPTTTTKKAASVEQLVSKDYSTAAGHISMADLSNEILDFHALCPGSSEDNSMQPSLLNRGTSRGSQSKFSGSLGSTSRVKSVPKRDLKGQDVESLDTTSLTRAMSSMAVSSSEPCYIEISD